MLFAEVLLRLANLGALQVADFDGDFVEGAADDGEGGDVGGVAVALDDLRGDGRGLEAQVFAHLFLLVRIQVTKRADGAGEFADAHALGGGGEADGIALHFGVPVEELEAEGGGLGVDAVSATDRGRMLEFDGAALEHGE